jgi:hypothetical protein
MDSSRCRRTTHAERLASAPQPRTGKSSWLRVGSIQFPASHDRRARISPVIATLPGEYAWQAGNDLARIAAIRSVLRPSAERTRQAARNCGNITTCEAISQKHVLPRSLTLGAAIDVGTFGATCPAFDQADSIHWIPSHTVASRRVTAKLGLSSRRFRLDVGTWAGGVLPSAHFSNGERGRCTVATETLELDEISRNNRPAVHSAGSAAGSPEAACFFLPRIIQVCSRSR